MQKGNFESTDSLLRRWIWVVIFAIAFAWVESSVVVYLRNIYYKNGFIFPIVADWQYGKLVIDNLMKIELVRELATIVMLAAVGISAGRNGWQKFSFFMIAFGIWDIFYYIWLRVMISWPESLMTWDLLFLIPLPWVGPVITPVLIALAMTAAGTLIIYFDEKSYQIRFHWYDWVIVLGCGLLMIIAFCWDWKNIVQLRDGIQRSGIPEKFFWKLYLPSYLFSVIYFGLRLKNNIAINNNKNS